MGGIILFIIISLCVTKFVLTTKENKGNPASLKGNNRENVITKKNINRGKNLYTSCIACHGEMAQGIHHFKAPSLISLDSWYIVAQIEKYKTGLRGNNPKNSLDMQMRPFALMLSNKQDMNDVAAYISSLKQTYSESPKKTVNADITRGKQLYSTCIACHGTDGKGDKSLNSPSLVGQHDWYILKQLQNFKDGLRGTAKGDSTGAIMRHAALAIGGENSMKDLSSYIATFE